MSTRIKRTTTIASGATKSGAVEDLKGYRLAGIQMPSDFTGTTLSFEAAAGPSDSYQAIEDGAGTAVELTVSGGEYILLDEQDVENLVGPWGIKLVSGSSEGADREIQLVFVCG